MDQVKEYLAVAIKHGFWIGSGIVLVGALAVWYLSTSDLNDQTESQIQRIKSDVQKVSQYRTELPEQPNELTHELMQEMIDERKMEVLKAWQNVFDAQRDILTWPEKLQDEFLREFKYAKDPDTGLVDRNKLKLPFEKYEEFTPDEPSDVNPELLRRYEKYIGDTLPSYAAIAKAEWKADFDKAGRRSGGMMGMGDEMEMGMMDTMAPGRRRASVDITGSTGEPVVKWSTSSQEAVLKDLFPWRGSKEYPSELDVYYSQENLWILRQLLQIIADVNDGAQQRFEADIREIKKLQIGKTVSFDNGNISDPGSRVKAGFGMGGGYGEEMMMMEDMEMMGSMMGEGMGGASVTETDPGDERYVNTALEPITASSLRSAFTSNDPNQVAIAVAKRVPVMLHLQMDQRDVPELLAACGSAPLMVDVHQVREMPKGASGGGSDEMGGMGGEEMMMGMEEGMMGMEGGMGGGAGPSRSVDGKFPLDMEVEIYGLIYFYNPPSEESLGIEKVTDNTSIDQSAEVVDPLPSPAPDTPADAQPPQSPDASTAPQPGAAGDGTGQPGPSQPQPGAQPAQPAQPDAGQPNAPQPQPGGAQPGAAQPPATEPPAAQPGNDNTAAGPTAAATQPTGGG